MAFLEVTQVQVTTGGVSEGKRVLIQSDNILNVATGSHDTSVVTLAGGDRLHTKEGFDELKKKLGV